MFWKPSNVEIYYCIDCNIIINGLNPRTCFYVSHKNHQETGLNQR